MSRLSDQGLGESKGLALLLCDQIIVDRDSGKRSLIGIFEMMNPKQFPATASDFSIYASVAREGSTETRYYLELVAPDGELLVKAILDMDEWGPTDIFQFEMRVPGMALPTAGVYLARVFVQGRVLLERRLLVQKLPESPEEQADLPTP
ncbi:MAG TPA: hypothetical protein VGQ99_14750 [Tepidisphaeraceae bacterium]|jgi:hypothetical protein|nr:hypothetical protein [Tepidisphaeraceae bacterium]